MHRHGEDQRSQLQEARKKGQGHRVEGSPPTPHYTKRHHPGPQDPEGGKSSQKPQEI